MSPYRAACVAVVVPGPVRRSWWHWLRTFWRRVAVAVEPRLTCCHCSGPAHWRTGWQVTEVYREDVWVLKTWPAFVCYTCTAIDGWRSMTLTPRRWRWKMPSSYSTNPPRGGWRRGRE